MRAKKWANKREVERTELYQKWQGEIETLSFNPTKIINNSLKKAERLIGQSKPENSNKLAKQALRHALAHLSEMESVFPEHEIIKEALAYGIGNTVLSDIKKVIKIAHKKSEMWGGWVI